MKQCICIRLGLAIVPFGHGTGAPPSTNIGAPFERYDTLRTHLAHINCCWWHSPKTPAVLHWFAFIWIT